MTRPRPAEIEAAIRACPHRDTTAEHGRCPCEGEVAVCGAGVSLRSDRTVTKHECALCQREKLQLHRATGPE